MDRTGNKQIPNSLLPNEKGADARIPLGSQLYSSFSPTLNKNNLGSDIPVNHLKLLTK
jgi:hypothetical protein